MGYIFDMPIHNREIAAMFYKLADLLEIEGDNTFRVRAYRNAARVIEGLSQNIADMLDEGQDLTELPGIGDALAKKIKTIIKTGKLPKLEKEEKHLPGVLLELMKIPNLGPKKIKLLFDTLHIKNKDDLKKVIASGRIQKIKGFSKKTEAVIKDGLDKLSRTEKRIPLIEAEEVAEPLLNFIKNIKGIKEVIVAGSYRRRRDTVGDLDILATAKKGATVTVEFVKYDEISEVISKGTTRSTVLLRSGIQVDLRVVPQVSYGAALVYFTGSKAHNIAIRKIAVQKKLKINEYGVFKGKKRVTGKTEKEVYQQVGLPYIEPELREDRGEIEAAKRKKLPKLIKLEEIRGDLHCHTTATDGQNSIESMAQAAAELGYEYIAITDHSKHLTVAQGLDRKRLLQQVKQIDRLNEKSKNIVILKAIEVDILEDGTLDLPDDVLKELDFTVCSVHYKFGLSRKKQTERVIRAMDNTYFNILGHPTGQLLGKREPYEIDLEKIMEAVKERGCILEVNAQPERMDLNEIYCKMAKDRQIKLVVSTDAHHTNQLTYMHFGVDQARRGWLEKKDVINTLPLKSLLKVLQR